MHAISSMKRWKIVLAYLTFLQSSPSPLSKQESLPVCDREMKPHISSSAVIITHQVLSTFPGFWNTVSLKAHNLNMKLTCLNLLKSALRVMKLKIYLNFIWGFQVDFSDRHNPGNPNQQQVRQQHIQLASVSHGQLLQHSCSGIPLHPLWKTLTCGQ